MGQQGLKNGLRQALQVASGRGHEGIVRYLLDKGAAVNALGDEVPALSRAVEGGHCPIIKLLLTEHPNIEVNDKFQRTPIFFTASRADTKPLEMLLEAQADANATDRLDQTALFAAALNGNEEVVKLLLDAGINVNARDVEGRTALLHIAAQQADALKRLGSEDSDQWVCGKAVELLLK